jgi:transcription elongation GreA/GreB family factor
MDETHTTRPNQRRRAPGRRKKRNRDNRRQESRHILTGHGRTVLSQRLLSLHRELAAAAWQCREIGDDCRVVSQADLDRLRQRALILSLEINQLESLLELADSPELEIGKAIGPGTAVRVVDAATGEPREYQLVACEPNPGSTVVSPASMVGQALIGRQLGSLITLSLPEGMRRVRVVATRPIGSPEAEEKAA